MAVDRIAARRRPAHIALFDATSLTARGVKARLVERSFPVASMRMFSSSISPETNLTEFNGEAMLVTTPDPNDLGPLDIAFLCGTCAEGRRYLEWPARKGFVAIDLTPAANRSDEVPLVNAAVNPDAIPSDAVLIATPHPISQFLSSLLAPLRKKCGLRRASVVAFEPAGRFGEPGIDELCRQTTALLNFQEVPREVFGRQLAFNLIPSFAQEDRRGPLGIRPEEIEAEVGRVIGGSSGLSIEVIQAPVFHCQSALANVELDSERSPQSLLAAFEQADDVRVGAEDDGTTPVDGAGHPGVAIRGVRSASGSDSFWIWALSDDQLAGTALNAVRIAEVILGSGSGGSAR